MKQAILLAITFALFVPCLSQIKEAQKMNEVGLESCDKTTSTLDAFISALQAEPNDKGYIIYYDGYQLSKNRKYVIWKDGSYRLGFFKRFLKGRKADESRIVYVNGGYRKEYSAEFWLVPEGAKTPKPSETVNPKGKKYRGFKVKRINFNCGEEGY